MAQPIVRARLPLSCALTGLRAAGTALLLLVAAGLLAGSGPAGTALGRTAGPARVLANGIALLAGAMGVPVAWRLRSGTAHGLSVHGELSLLQFAAHRPALLLAVLAVPLVAALHLGWLVHRRHRRSDAPLAVLLPVGVAAFAGSIAAGSALAGRLLHHWPGAGVSLTAAPGQALLAAAVWGLAGATAGVALRAAVTAGRPRAADRAVADRAARPLPARLIGRVRGQPAVRGEGAQCT
jgi:hypothetical protein